jgi:D-glycero-D-manno-heptose 1,7-bisphosphate phosphatase
VRRRPAPGPGSRAGGTPAVFVDRDGTLNREVHYLRRVADLRLTPGAAAGVRALTDAGFAVVVVTNQSGVARGVIAPATLDAIHAALTRRLARAGARVAGIYVCPHHPSEGAPPLRRRCGCRKPAAGLAVRAARELGLDLARSYVVGDGTGDLGLAAAIGARAVLVRTGHGRDTEAARDPALPLAHIAPNFRAAAGWIIDDMRSVPAKRRSVSAERRSVSAKRRRGSAKRRRGSARQQRRQRPRR